MKLKKATQFITTINWVAKDTYEKTLVFIALFNFVVGISLTICGL